MSNSADIAVIALGNLLMGDEGVGIHLLHQLEEMAIQHTELIELGTAGLPLLYALEGRRKAILLDCAFMGEPPGTIRRFTSTEVRSVKRLAGVSLHEGDILQTLALAQGFPTVSSDIVLLGIEPAEVSPKMQLSPLLSAKLPEYLNAVCAEISSNLTPRGATPAMAGHGVFLSTRAAPSAKIPD